MTAATAAPPASRRPRRIRPRRVALYAAMLIIAAFYIFPIYLLLITAFKSFDQVSLSRMWDLPQGLSLGSFDRAWNGGDKGITCIPGREDEFRAGVALALDYAQALGCPRIHLMAGLLPAGVSREAAQRTYVANLRWAAAEAARHGRDVLIEPINTRDIPGFFLNRQDQAHALVAEVGASNIKVQMDLYHCQIVEGDLATKLRRYLPTGRVGHVQMAGVPERHEPDQGEVYYPYLFGLIDALGYGGWIGCEYRPRAGTSAGLGWRTPPSQ